jgi:uncharacterized protein
VVAASEPVGTHLVVDGRTVASLELAVARNDRRKGLLGRTAVVGALMITPCRSVHTVGMQFAIDVAHIDRGGVVLHCTTMKPGRISRVVWRSHSVLEAKAGAFSQWGLRVGSHVSATESQ